MSKINYLTVNQLSEACKSNKYILCKFSSGKLMGINTRCASIAKKRNKYNDNDLTEFVGYIPCNINSYINLKHPYGTKRKD